MSLNPTIIKCGLPPDWLATSDSPEGYVLAEPGCEEARLEISKGVHPAVFNRLPTEKAQLLELEKIAGNPSLIALLRNSKDWGVSDPRNFFHLHARSQAVHQKIDELFFVWGIAETADRSLKYLQGLLSGAFFLFSPASSPDNRLMGWRGLHLGIGYSFDHGHSGPSLLRLGISDPASDVAFWELCASGDLTRQECTEIIKDRHTFRLGPSVDLYNVGKRGSP